MRLTQLFLESSELVGHKVGIFIQLPSELAKKFPRLSEDDSPSHITVLYLGDQPIDKEDNIVTAAKQAIKTIEPFELELGNLSHFHHSGEEYEKVAIMRIKSENLRKLRSTLEKIMKDNGVVWENKWGSYKPHVTLAYLPAGDEYAGEPISGKWKCTEIKIWGFKKKHTIKLKTTD